MNRILADQVRRNRMSREFRDAYAAHRDRVTELLCAAAARPDARLCVLGAGNCHDLELARLLAGFRNIHLVDLDGEALDLGIAGQIDPPDKRVVAHRGVDVTGVADEFCRFTPDDPPGEPLLREILDRAVTARPACLAETYDVTASVCLLTQLIDAIKGAVGEAHPRFVDIVQIIRLRHLQMLVEATRPGGDAFLITDLVSSLTWPDLPDVPAHQLPDRLVDQIEAGNFFTGTNPAVLQALPGSQPQLAALLDEAEIYPPWRWNFGPWYYAVYALRMRRRAAR